MECPTPIMVYGKHKILGQREQIPVPCGKCLICLEKRRLQWTIRLKEELRASGSASFITLTYADEYLPKYYPDDSDNWIASLSKRDIQLFLKQIRNYHTRVVVPVHSVLKVSLLSEKGPNLASSTIRYFCAGEYGSQTFRPHYHILLFNAEKILVDNIHEIWHRGNVKTLPVHAGSLHYVTKYLINPTPDKFVEYPGLQKPFLLMSRRPGIGFQYLSRVGDYHEKTEHEYYVMEGSKSALPRYYADKVWNSEEDKLKMALKRTKKNQDVRDKEDQENIKLGYDPNKQRFLRAQEKIRRIAKRSKINNKL